MAQWIRRLTTNQEIPGSTPGSLNFFDVHVINVRRLNLPLSIVSCAEIYVFRVDLYKKIFMR